MTAKEQVLKRYPNAKCFKRPTKETSYVVYLKPNSKAWIICPQANLAWKGTLSKIKFLRRR